MNKYILLPLFLFSVSFSQIDQDRMTKCDACYISLLDAFKQVFAVIQCAHALDITPEEINYFSSVLREKYMSEVDATNAWPYYISQKVLQGAIEGKYLFINDFVDYPLETIKKEMIPCLSDGKPLFVEPVKESFFKRLFKKK